MMKTFEEQQEALERDNELRRKALAKNIKWMQVRKAGLLLAPAANLAPQDGMLGDSFFYPTKCYGKDRTKGNAVMLPIKYDKEYLLAYYREKVTRNLSLENQLAFLQLVIESYGDLVKSPTESDPLTQLQQLPDEEKLTLCKSLADSLGKRLIKK